MRLEVSIGAPHSPVLDAYIACRERVSIIRGPRGSGKTFGSASRALLHMVEQQPNAQGVRPSRGMVCRDSYTELMSTTVKDFLSVFEGLGKFSTSDGGKGVPTWRTHPGLELPDGTRIEAEVVFQSAGVDDAEERVKGYQLTWAWFNEMSGVERAVFENSRAACSRYPSLAAGGVQCSWYGVFGDTNSFDESHWLFELAQRPPEGWRWFHQPGGVIDSGKLDVHGRRIWLPNPNAENLCNLVGRERYYKDLCAGAKDDHIRVLLANEYGFHVDGMPVHPWYVDSVHCAPEEFEPERALPIILGVDFGRTPAAALCQFNPTTGRWTIFDELVTTNMSASIFGPELKRYLDRRYPRMEIRGFGDPAGHKAGQTVETTPTDVLRAAGIPINPAPSNDVTLRRAALSGPAGRLCIDGRPGLLVSPRAKMIRKGLMGGFCYRRLKIAGTDRYTDEPDKNQFSHPVEAAEYALEGGGEMHTALRPAYAQQRQSFNYNEGYDPFAL